MKLGIAAVVCCIACCSGAPQLPDLPTAAEDAAIIELPPAVLVDASTGDVVWVAPYDAPKPGCGSGELHPCPKVKAR